MLNVFINHNQTQGKTEFYQSSLEAGSGKSYTTYKLIAESKSNTVIVIPRIDLIEEQLKQFGSKAIAVHSNDNDPRAVQTKIANAIEVIESTSKHILVITHKGFLEYTRWADLKDNWNLVIDEYMEYFTATVLPTAISSNTEEFWSMFTVVPTDSTEYTQLRFSDNAVDMFKNKTDFICEAASFNSLYSLSKNNLLAIKRTDYGKVAESVTFLALLDAEMFEAFSTVTFLADGFSDSQLCKYLHTAENIKFKTLDIAPYKQRTKSIAERITIYQLTERDISSYLMSNLTGKEYKELNSAVNSIAQTNSTIWTANQKFTKQLNINGQYLTPKQSGSNEYKDKTTAVWLASMKTSPTVLTATEEFIGLQSNALDEVKELEPMHQFIARTNIREYDSVQPINVVVFGPQQAMYLCRRYNIEYDRVVHLDVEIQKKQHKGSDKTFANRAEQEKFARNLKKIDNKEALRLHIKQWFIETAKRVGRYEPRFEDIEVRHTLAELKQLKANGSKLQSIEDKLDIALATVQENKL